jgi:hypothetical protein
MRGLFLILFLTLFTVPNPAQAQTCRLALVLALDVSGSVNKVEYAQQLNGLAYALDSAEVRTAVLARKDAFVHLAVFEWSSQNHQFLVQPWIALDSNDDIDRAVARILAFRKKRAGLKTALSTALLYASELLIQKSECWIKTIDVSGDGKNNIGPPIEQVYALSAFSQVTVNALVVSNASLLQAGKALEDHENSDLRRYYEREVIRGPGSFAMVAQGYADYERAMQKKLLREISVPILGSNGD